MVMRIALAALFLVAVASAGPKGKVIDEVDPRSPDTPLKIVFRPYYCETCAAEGRIEPQNQVISMMRMEVGRLAKVLDLDKGWIVIQTPNFKILSTLARAKVKFKGTQFARADLKRLQEIFPKLRGGREGFTVNPHQRAHLYHIRAERVYSHFAALTDNKQKFLGMQGRYQLILLEEYTPYHTLTDQFIGRGQRMAGIQHHMKEPLNFNLFVTSEQQTAQTKGKGDRLFNNWVVHNVAHNLVDGHGNYYRETWAWLEEGIGHYYERRESTAHNTFCWSEGKPPSDFLKPDWESVIYGLVRRGRDTPLNQWCEKLQPGELSGTENGLSWSIVKWLIETDPIRFTKMLRKLDDYKTKPNAEQCIQYAFNCSPSVLHRRWREYVLANYNKKR